MNMAEKFEKYGVKPIVGGRIIEGDLSYIEEIGSDEVMVVTIDGIRENLHTKDLETFVKNHPMSPEVREELKMLIDL